MYRAKQPFFVGNRMVRRRELVFDNDPVLRGREQFFERIEEVEQATAAPGERRNVRRKPAGA